MPGQQSAKVREAEGRLRAEIDKLRDLIAAAKRGIAVPRRETGSTKKDYTRVDVP